MSHSSPPISLGENKHAALRQRGIDGAATAAGADFVVQALDPFHDYSLGPARVPGPVVGPTVARRLRYAFNLDVPAGWNVVIFTTNVLNSPVTAGVECIISNSGVGTLLSLAPVGSTTSKRFGPLMAMFYPADREADVTTLYGTAVAYPARDATGELTRVAQLLPLVADGTNLAWRDGARFVSGGYEITNTTATIDQSGFITTARGYGCYGKLEPAVRASAGTTAAEPNRYAYVAGLSPAALTQLPNSVTWEAAEGAYVVLASSDGQYKMRDVTTGALISAARTTGADSTRLFTGQRAPWQDSAIAGQTAFVWNESYIAPVASVIGGLSRDATFRVDVRLNLEMPALNAGDLTIAHPALEFDPKALATVMRAFAELPAATKVGNNSAGDWFRVVLAKLAQVAPILAPVIPHPVVRAVVQGVGTAAGAASAALRRPATEQTQRMVHTLPRSQQPARLNYAPALAKAKAKAKRRG